MNSNSSERRDHYHRSVVLRYQLYNSLFTSLPFQTVEKTGILLSLLQADCHEGLERGDTVDEIINSFFERQPQYETEDQKIDLLFRFVQYVERQIVLFDALEDAAVEQLNDLRGAGTLKQLGMQSGSLAKKADFADLIKQFHVRLVLTAHPTQFYPGSVLGIINDLSEALATDDLPRISTYLEQLGRTPFFKKKKPTPYDEAISLIWFLENIFYAATSEIGNEIKSLFPKILDGTESVLKMGFWPGGDRDGNPFVNHKTTLDVARALRTALLRAYYRQVRRLKRRLTFSGVDTLVAELDSRLNSAIYEHNPDDPASTPSLTLEDLSTAIAEIIEQLRSKHNGLFVEHVERLQNSVAVFGMHFASIDIRQDSGFHERIIAELSGVTDYADKPESEKLKILKGISKPGGNLSEDAAELLATIKTIAKIQSENGRQGCERYVISHSRFASDVLAVMALFDVAGVSLEQTKVSIVPLFETVEDLKNASGVMQQLYDHPRYGGHLKNLNNQQTIMMGFSDGTKDGGYLMANYGIFKAKQELTKTSVANGIQVTFFDGRGGPPARGGGKTHRFYASMGSDISTNQIELTIQGQTVSSKFGTVQAARFNAEQLIHAGLSSGFSDDIPRTFTAEEDELLKELSSISYQSYQDLKSHPSFVSYLSEMTPLQYYGQTNIGSRPAKRSKKSDDKPEFRFEDLRAIPFVGAWSQMKQNVPGFFGVGTAIEKMEASGHGKRLQSLYQSSAFFRALMDNCEMAVTKCDFRLTRHLETDKQYGEFWCQMHDEYKRTRAAVLRVSEKTELMSDYPVDRASIDTRERIVKPLTTIQQFALMRIRELAKNDGSTSDLKDDYEKLVMRCSFGIINASRNSA